MGARISYYKNNFGKGLKEIIFENFVPFRQWFLDSDESSVQEINEPFGNEQLKKYLQQNTNFNTDFNHLDKNLIDELTSEFVGSYCDLINRKSNLLEPFGPTMNKWRYEKSSRMVFETKDEELIRIWNYVIKGRSLKDNADFNSYKNDYKIGFLISTEQRILKQKIENYFGNIEAIKQNYWTINEKKELDKAIANSNTNSYHLSGHNPKSSGLEYVLEAIGELDDNNIEMIIAIE